MAPPPGRQANLLTSQQQGLVIAALQGNRHVPAKPNQNTTCHAHSPDDAAASHSGSEDIGPSRPPWGLVGTPPNINAIVAELKHGKRPVKPLATDNDRDAKKAKPRPMPKPRHLVKPPIKPKPRQNQHPSLANPHQKMDEQERPVAAERTRITVSSQQKRSSLQRNPQVQTRWKKVEDFDLLASDGKEEGIMDNGGRPVLPKKPVFLKLSSGQQKQIQLTRNESVVSNISDFSATSEICDVDIKHNGFEKEVSDLSQRNYSGTTENDKWRKEVVVTEGDAKIRIDNSTGESIYDTTLKRPLLARSQSAESVLHQELEDYNNETRGFEPVAASRVPFRHAYQEVVRYGYSSNYSITEDESDDWSGGTVSAMPSVDSSPGGTLGIKRERGRAIKGRTPNQMQDLTQLESPYTPQRQLDIGKQLKGFFQKRFSSEEMLSAKEVENLRHEMEAESKHSNLSDSPVEEKQGKKKEKKKKKGKKVKKHLKNLGKLKDKLKLGGSETSTSMEEELPPVELQSEEGVDGTSDSDFDDGDYFSDFTDDVADDAEHESGWGQDTESVHIPPKSTLNQKRLSYESIEIDHSDDHTKVILKSGTPPIAADRRLSKEDSIWQETVPSGGQDAVINPALIRTDKYAHLESGIYETCNYDDEEEEDKEGDEGEGTVGEVNGEDAARPDGQVRLSRLPYDQFSPSRSVDSDDHSDDGDYEDVAPEEPSSEEGEAVDAQCPPIFESRSLNTISRVTEAAHHPNTSQVGADDMSQQEGMYSSMWIEQEPAANRSVEDHVYDSTPSSKMKIAYKYTQIDKVSRHGRGAFVIREDKAVEDFQDLSLGSNRDEEAEDDDDDDCDDGASTCSGESVGVAYSEQEEMDIRRITRGGSSGRYTQDGKSGAVFSFAHALPDSQPWNEETGTSSCLSPDFEKRGPKLPPRMSTPTPDNGRLSSNYQLVHLPAQEEMDMTGNSDKDHDLPLYQVYTEGLQRKETLLLLQSQGEEKRKQIMENASRSSKFWPSDSGSSGDSVGLVDGPEPGMENYSDWGMSDYGMMVPEEKPVQEDFYEPLAYEEYLEDKRKKLFPLWRDQEAIISSGLLSKLTPREQELQEALYEIITSEDSYLRSINLVVNHFMESQLLRELLGTMNHHTLFSNIVAVRNVSQRLYEDLSTYHESSFTLEYIPKIIHNHLEGFNCYVHYCGNNQHQVDLMNKIKKQPEVKAEIHRLEKHPDCQHLDLMSFLMLPFQRITRLPLLIKAVVDRSSSKLAEEAQLIMAETTELVKRCNNNARRMEEIKELQLVFASLHHKSGVKHVELSQNAVVKKKGTIRTLSWEVSKLGKRKIGIKKKVLIVTTEKVIIAKERMKGDQKRFEVQDWCMTNRVTTEDIRDEQKMEMFPSGLPPDACSIFRLTFLENHQKVKEEYDLCTQKESDKERWITALSTSSWGEHGEKIYDDFDCPLVFCIKAIKKTHDIDELDLQLYEKLDVLKKMDDGWWEGRRLRDNKVGWFPGSHVEELETDHSKARELKLLHTQETQSREDFSWAR